MTRRMWLAVLAMLGIFIAAYLTLYHYGYIGTLACSGDGQGCSTVQASKWSRLFGVPVATWGLGYYSSVFVLALVGLQERFVDSRPLTSGLLLLTAWGAVFSGWLTYLEAGPIGAWCQWCIGSAIVAALLFVVAFLDWRASASSPVIGRAD
jgi:uncharacterized membrane protein